eukprot:m.158188 g.158188  ORF g.158188 m.158188 type:complete len:1377 (+) comp16461_c0_seq1:123-4253(+)
MADSPFLTPTNRLGSGLRSRSNHELDDPFLRGSAQRGRSRTSLGQPDNEATDLSMQPSPRRQSVGRADDSQLTGARRASLTRRLSDQSPKVAVAAGRELNDSYFQHQRVRAVSDRLRVYREDLADWFSQIFGLDIHGSTFISEIETGVLLCKLALLVNNGSEGSHTRGFASGHGRRVGDPVKIRYNMQATKGSFFAMDNVACFVAWCRYIGVDDAVLFEPEDLVRHKNEKNVLYCLMEVARVQTAFAPPALVQLERRAEHRMTRDELAAMLAAVEELCLRLETSPDRVQHMGDNKFTVDGNGPFPLDLLRGRVLVNMGQRQWDELATILDDPSAVIQTVSMQRSHPPRRISRTVIREEVDVSPLKKRIQELEALLADKDAQLQQATLKNRRASSGYENAAQQVTRLEAQLEDTRSTLQNRLGEARDLQDEVDRLKILLARMQDERSRELSKPSVDMIPRPEHEDLLAQQQFQIEAQHATAIKRLRSQFEVETAQLNSAVMALEASIGRYEAEAAAARADAANARGERDDILARLQTVEQTVEQQNEQLAAKDERIAELEALLAANGTMSDQLQALQDKLEKQQLALANEQATNAALTDEIQPLRLLPMQVAQVHEQMEGLQRQIAQLTQERDEALAALAALQAKAGDDSALQEALAAAEADKNQLKDANADLEAQLRALHDQLNSAGDENDRERSMVGSVQQQLTNLLAELEALRQQLLDEKSGRAEDNARADADKSALQARLDDADRDNKRLKEEIEELKRRLAADQDDSEQLQLLREDASRFKAERDEALDKNHDLQEEIDRLKAAFDAAEVKCGEEKDDLRKQLAQAQQERDEAIAAKAELEAVNAELAAQVDDQVLEIDRLKALLAEKDAYITELEARLAELQAQLNDALARLNALEGEAEEQARALRAADDAEARRKAEEDARRAAEEAARLAAEDEAARRQAELDSAERDRQAALDAEAEAQRAADEEAARLAAENDAARLAEENDAARLAAEEEEAHRLALEALQSDESKMRVHHEMQPYREDLCEWVNEMLGTNYKTDTFLLSLQNGVALAELANAIDGDEEETRELDAESAAARAKGKPKSSSTAASKSKLKSKTSRGDTTKLRRRTRPDVIADIRSSITSAHEPIRLKRRRIPNYHYVPPKGESVLANYIKTRNVNYCRFEPLAKAGTDKARVNLTNFIVWARSLGLQDPDVFEVEDLTELRDERRVLWGLMDVARRTRRIRVPRLVWLERMRYLKRTAPVKGDALDAAVRKVVNRCINQPLYKVTRVAEKKYTFGEEMTAPVLIRIVGKNVMVRVGGGWEELYRYLDSRFDQDPRMEADKERYEDMWSQHKTASEKGNPYDYEATNGQKIELHTTRSNLHTYVLE